MSAPSCAAAEAVGDGAAEGTDEPAGGVAKGWGTLLDGELVRAAAAAARLPDGPGPTEPEPDAADGAAAWDGTAGAVNGAAAAAVPRGLASVGAVAVPCGLGAGRPAGPGAGRVGRAAPPAGDDEACEDVVGVGAAKGDAVRAVPVDVAGTGCGVRTG